jgi:hypothetical protein
MIDLTNRDFVSRIIDYGIESEYNHLLGELYTAFCDDDELDFDSMSEQEVLDFCLKEDIDHIWIDFFLLEQSIKSLT